MLPVVGSGVARQLRQTSPSQRLVSLDADASPLAGRVRQNTCCCGAIVHGPENLHFLKIQNSDFINPHKHQHRMIEKATN